MHRVLVCDRRGEKKQGNEVAFARPQPAEALA
jgi:hypothetical protein